MPPETATAAPVVWTIRALLTWTTDFLAKKGIDSPRLDAELLLAHVLHCNRIDLIVRYSEEPTAAERTGFRELVMKRAERWPTAYLIGKREFYLLSFEVTPAVLVPRPDTETLVLKAMDLLKGIPHPKVLELGTGSGCVAVSLAHMCKIANVTAVDISPDALDVAKRNAVKHGVADRITFLLGDWYAPVPDGETFDLIVSNPPYIPPAELAELAPEVRDHEPRLALDGGPDGLAFYRRMAMGLSTYLKPGGTIAVEIGSTQEPDVRAIFADTPGFSNIQLFKDMANRPRVVTASYRRTETPAR